MTNREHSITLTRTIRAAPTEVYSAWTDPEIMRRWLAPRVEADVTVGGRYQLDHHEHGSFAGVFVALEPGQRLLLTFAGVADPPGANEHLEVSLRPVARGRTELVLINSWTGDDRSPEVRTRREAAWQGWLDRLVEGLEPSQTQDP
jgi:uncharacterized protein YndB with AHSA1/START domain